MGKYSISEDISSDEAFDISISEIMNYFFSIIDKNDIESIFLIGGFGRGEGGIYKDGDKYSLVNDIDLILVPKKNKNAIKKKIPAVIDTIVRNNFFERTGLKQVDLSIATKFSLRYSPNLISYYEMREGNKNIFGNLDLKSIIRERKPEKLPLFDGTRLFFNRGYGLLIADYILREKLYLNEIFKNNILIELQKACIAMGDALLLINGKYHFSYKKRMNNFKILISNKNYILKDKIDVEKIGEIYLWALDGKLKPTKETFDLKYVEKFFEIKDLFLKFFIEYDSHRLKTNFRNYIDYSAFILKNDVNDPLYLKLRRKFKELSRISIKYIEQKRMLAILPHVLESINSDYTINKNYLERVRNKLKDEKLLLALNDNEDILKFLLNSYHPDGIISSILSYEERKQKIN